ncbi:hypothetical protein PINS_up022477 [Pythium insidiosum]|nr:hypothetical protein PINS_up022477 [Pythium insidiosum]
MAETSSSSSSSVSFGAAATAAVALASASKSTSLLRRWSRRAVQATPPPLPLISLPPDDDWAEFDVPARTGFSYSLPYVALEDEEETDTSPCVDAAHAHAPAADRARVCALLSEYMTQNELYQTRRHGFGIDTTLVYKRHKHASAADACATTASSVPSDDLQFDAFFESGNLDRAFRVLGRHYASKAELLAASGELPSSSSTSSASSPSSSSPPFPFFVKTDLEYDLYCDTDVNTHGHIQWYFFRVAVSTSCFRRREQEQEQAQAPTQEEQTETPPPPEQQQQQQQGRLLSTLKVRFNLRNMLKKSSLYNDGMLPAVYIAGQRGWHHAGTNVCYFRNADTYRHRKTGKPTPFYTLSFVYEFARPNCSATANESGVVHYYFAHCYPYPYTRLQRYLLSLQQNPLRRRVLRRRVLCKTMAGNICDVLTITDFSRQDDDSGTRSQDARPGVVLTARVHPGESNSSFVMHGVLDFLTSESLEARYLRHRFVFKVVPMLNPDGVIHGNYRCSLAGTDLNRRYRDPSRELHPTVHAVKALVLSLQRTRGVSLYCDLHGHSRKKNIFLYGCVPHAPTGVTTTAAASASAASAAETASAIASASASTGDGHAGTSASAGRSDAARLRLFPHVLSKTCGVASGGYYSFADCTFSVSSSKRGTGRVVMWHEARVLHSFTLEASFFGVGVNAPRDGKKQRRHQQHSGNNNNNSNSKTSNTQRPTSSSKATVRRDTTNSPRLRNENDLALSTRHFMPSDLRRAGQRLCLALVPFGHLLRRPTSSSSSSSAGGGASTASDIAGAAAMACHASTSTSVNSRDAAGHESSSSQFFGHDAAATTPSMCFSPGGSRRPMTTTAIATRGDDNNNYQATTESSAALTMSSRPRLAPLRTPSPRARDAFSTTAAENSVAPSNADGDSDGDAFDALFLSGSELFGDMGDPEELLKEIEESLPEDVLEQQQQQRDSDEEDESPGSESDPSGDDMEEEELHRQPSWTAMIAVPHEEEIVAELPPSTQLKEPRAQKLLKRFSDSQLYVFVFFSWERDERVG